MRPACYPPIETAYASAPTISSLRSCICRPSASRSRSSSFTSGEALAAAGLRRGVEAPQGGEADQDVDDARDRGAVAEQRGDEVDVEQADQAPVHAADDEQDHRDPVDGAHGAR